MIQRNRLTWNQGRHAARDTRAAARPANPTEDGGHPAAKEDPNEHDYEIGGPSDFAEDVHPGPYQTAEPPALPSEIPSMKRSSTQNAIKQALLKKASVCTRIAKRMLPKTASEEVITRQATDLMSIDNNSLVSTAKRLGCYDDSMMLDPMMPGPDPMLEVDPMDELMFASEEPTKAEDHADPVGEKMLASMLRQEKLLAASLKPSRRAAEEPPKAEEHKAEDHKAEDHADPVGEKMLASMLRQERARVAAMAAGSRPSRPSRVAAEETDEEAEKMLASMLADRSASKARRAGEGGPPPEIQEKIDQKEEADDEAAVEKEANRLAAAARKAAAKLAQIRSAKTSKKPHLTAAAKAFATYKALMKKAAEEGEVEDPAAEEAPAEPKTANRKPTRRAAEEPVAEEETEEEETEEEETEEEGEEIDASSDPMGLDAPIEGFDDDLAVFAEAPAEEAPKTAAARTAASRASRVASSTPRVGPKKLGTVQAAPRGSKDELEGLWSSMPDVSASFS